MSSPDIAGLNLPDPLVHPRDVRGDEIDRLGIVGDRDGDER